MINELNVIREVKVINIIITVIAVQYGIERKYDNPSTNFPSVEELLILLFITA